MKNCAHCGAKIRDDALYCASCGSAITSRKDYIKKNSWWKRQSETRQLMVVVGALLGVGLILLLALSFNTTPPVEETTPVVAEEVNKTEVVEETVTTKTDTRTRLIDSGSTSGFDNQKFHSNYVSTWNTYATGDNMVKINVNWNFQDTGQSISQTITLEKISNDPSDTIIRIIPTLSGRSGYESLTSISHMGYDNVVDYYWGYYKNRLYFPPAQRH
ncbi:hypothetical protein JCM15415_18410 [Methanobacterium movens]